MTRILEPITELVTLLTLRLGGKRNYYRNHINLKQVPPHVGYNLSSRSSFSDFQSTHARAHPTLRERSITHEMSSSLARISVLPAVTACRSRGRRHGATTARTTKAPRTVTVMAEGQGGRSTTHSQHHLSTQGRDGESLSEIPVTRREGFLAAASIALSSAFVDATVAPPAALAIYNKDLDKVRVFRHHHSQSVSRA